MKIFRKFCRYVAVPMAVVLAASSMPIGAAQAGLVGTHEVVDRAAADAERSRVLAFLDRADVREHLQAMGVDPNEASARVGSLSDQEVSQLASRIDMDPAGGDTLGTIVVVALVVAAVLFLTDIVGLTNVFPGIRSVQSGTR